MFELVGISASSGFSFIYSTLFRVHSFGTILAILIPV